MAQTDRKWYQNMFQRKGIWKHLLSPLYIMVVMFLSILLLSGTFLHIIWYPWVYYITNQDTSLSKLRLLSMYGEFYWPKVVANSESSL